jgi:hypothetical protein
MSNPVEIGTALGADTIPVPVEINFSNLVEVITELRRKVNSQASGLAIVNVKLQEKDDELDGLNKVLLIYAPQL